VAQIRSLRSVVEDNMKYYIYWEEKPTCSCCRTASGFEEFDDLDQLNAEYPTKEYDRTIILGTNIEDE
jgi:hypothetical protein